MRAYRNVVMGLGAKKESVLSYWKASQGFDGDKVPKAKLLK